MNPRPTDYESVALYADLSSPHQPSQPRLCIVNFSEDGVRVFPELEEFFVMLYGFADHFLLREIHPAQQVLEAGV